jgi:hypothetical protein
LREGRTLIVPEELKHRSFRVILAIAIAIAMSGWIYGLGWVAFKFFEFV